MPKSILKTILLVTAFSTSALASNPDVTAFVHANVVPMDRNTVLRDQTVLVSSGKIQSIGPSASLKAPKGARVINARGKYLMPGLADMHVHIYYPEELDLYAVNGVTTVFNLNGKPQHLYWRDQVAKGNLLGPTIYSAGPTMDHPRTAEAAVKEVDQQSAAGYDAVKIYNQVSAAEYPALTAEAHKKNLVLIGHIAREPGFAATLNAGQSIAHAEEYLYTFFNHDPNPDHDLSHPNDPAEIPQAVAMTKQAGISLVATLVAYHNIVRQMNDLPGYLRDPDFKYLSPFLYEQLQPGVNGYQQRMAKEDVPHLQPNYEFQGKLVKALHDGGVPILAGTDSAGDGLGVPGFSLIEEVENFQALGFTPYAALQTATTDAAALLKQSEVFGTVSAGKRADLLLLDRNPLDDVHNLHAIAGVMARGRWISRKQRASDLAAIPARYRDTTERLASQLKNDPAQVDKYLADNDPFGEQAGEIVGAVVGKNGPEEAKNLLLAAQKRNPDSLLISEESVNQMGYLFLGEKRSEVALELFQLNTDLYPKSGNTYDSLAEAYLGLGNKDLARKYYQRALEVQPDYRNAKNAKEILASKLK